MSGAPEVAFDEAFEGAALAETSPAASPEIAAPEAPSDPAPSEIETPPPVQAAPAPAAEPQDPMAPVKALLDERDRRQAAERKAAQLEAWRAEQERKAREATELMPHPLDDPEGFSQWLLHQQQVAVQREVGSLSSRHQQQVEVISKTMMQRYLGPEKFGELEKFIEAAPDQAHAIAMRQADPYGWFHEKFEQAQKARKAEDAARELEKLGGKSIDDIVAERVAAELAKQTQAATPAPASDTRARNSDGTFASPSTQTQRHQPPNLAAIQGAVAPAGGDARTAFDQAIPS